MRIKAKKISLKVKSFKSLKIESLGLRSFTNFINDKLFKNKIGFDKRKIEIMGIKL